MFRNYLKTAFRNLLRYKGFSFINILSLTVGITGCLLIGLFVIDERSFDDLPAADRTFRFYDNRSTPEGETRTAMVPPMFAPFAQANFPDVEVTTRLLYLAGRTLFEQGGKKSFEENGFITDSSFFTLFPLPLKWGNAATALRTGHHVVLSEALAEKYFGQDNPVGKTVTFYKTPYEVTGVLKGSNDHFHMNLTYLIPMSELSVPAERMQSWGWGQFFTYVRLRSAASKEAFAAKFRAAIDKKVNDEEEGVSGVKHRHELMPLRDIHLNTSDFQFEVAKRGNRTYVNALSVIALFVLLIAGFNFINLATARSFRRAREVGVRKAIGADRRQLLLQFTFETVLLALFSVVLASLFTRVFLPALNGFTGKSISFNPFLQPLLALALLLAGIVIGILAGIYPALVLSGFRPVQVLKGSKGNSGGAIGLLRQGLVVTQFALSALLIVCALSVYRQVNFLRQKDLGFQKDQVLSFQLPDSFSTKVNALKAELMRVPGVVSATAGYGLPGDIYATETVKLVAKGGEDRNTVLFIVDEDYVKTLGLKIAAGRDFSHNIASDRDHGFLINESAAREFGFGTAEAAVGQELDWETWADTKPRPVKRGRVLGVVKDFHYKSLHDKVGAVVLNIWPEYYKMAVKVRAGQMDGTIAQIKSAWARFVPEPLDYNFLDESYGKMYAAEEKLGTLLWIFTLMAICIGCMGLFGLAAYAAEQRVKEIGIRKVLGASLYDITALLSGSFIKLVVVSLLVAFPIAWWAMNQWLKDFAYRTDVSWWIFLLAAGGVLLVALLTVGFQTIRAAMGNPVKTLRTE
jgi:putative ABC transport system permease protein